MTSEFFDTLFGDLEDEFVEVRFIPDKDRNRNIRQEWFSSVDEAEKAAMHPPAGYGSFVGVLPRKSRMGAARDVSRVQTVYADIDNYKNGKTKDDVLAELKKLTCPPTMVIDSGGGFHIYWRLQSPADPKEAKRLMRRIAVALDGDTAVADVARVLRVPGTVNGKEEYPRPVRLVQANASNTYTFAELQDTFQVPEPVPEPKEPDEVGTTIFLGERTITFLERGELPEDGTERNHLLGIARNLSSAGLALDEATELMWDATQKHAIGTCIRCDPKDPWLKEDIEKVVFTIYSSDPTVDLEAEPQFEIKLAVPSTGRLAPLDLTDFLAHEPPPPEYIVKDWLIRKEVVTMTGKWGSGKSWLSLDLALAIASGREEWVGQKVTMHGPVLYFDEESSEELLHERLFMLGADPEKLAGNLFVYLNNDVRLDSKDWISEVHSIVDRVEPVLVVFDSSIRFHSRDENSAVEMAELYGKAIKPISRRYNSAVLMLDHPTKASPMGEARGSGEKAAALDRGWSLKPVNDVSGKLAHNKVRRGVQPEDLTVIRRVEDGIRMRLVVDENEQAEGTEDKVVSLLMTNSDGLKASDIIDILEIPKRTCHRVLSKLADDGQVSRTPDSRYVWAGVSF